MINLFHGKHVQKKYTKQLGQYSDIYVLVSTFEILDITCIQHI